MSWNLFTFMKPSVPRWPGAVESDKREPPPLILPRDTTAVFAVSEYEPWWIAVHLLLDELEKEMVIGARNQVANTNVCISAVGAGEGVAMVRQRLIETRKIALRKPAA